MNRYKGSPGWFKESHRHSLAAKGVKTGRKGYCPVMKPINYAENKREIRKVTSFTDGEFEYSHQPIEDTIKVTELPDGYEVKYLVQDEDPQSPDEWGDDSLFLVHYHRDFEVDRNNIITEDDARDWYQGSKIKQEKDYWLIPIEAYIHSGVSLAISNEGNFPDRQWDVSHVGIALASKKEFKTKDKAREAVKGLVSEWNQYLGGDVYGIVVEKFDKEKNLVDTDSVWGYNGYDDALKELESTHYTPSTPAGQKKVSDFAKPTKKEIRAWFTKAMGHKPIKDYYIEEWYDRFESPRRVWSYSDYDRRESLKKTFPEKFGDLDKDANLNNPENQIPKYDKW